MSAQESPVGDTQTNTPTDTPNPDAHAHANLHNLILPSEDLPLEGQEKLAKLQAMFRGKRERSTHVVWAKEGRPVCPFIRTPHHTVEEMAHRARVAEGDVVYDLGCGDGAITLGLLGVLRGAGIPQGVRFVGFDIDTVHLSTARRGAEDMGLGEW